MFEEFKKENDTNLNLVFWSQIWIWAKNSLALRLTWKKWKRIKLNKKLNLRGVERDKTRAKCNKIWIKYNKIKIEYNRVNSLILRSKNK